MMVSTNVRNNTNSTNSKDCSIISKRGWNGVARECHFNDKDRQTRHFNEKSQTKVRNSLMLISVC